VRGVHGAFDGAFGGACGGGVRGDRLDAGGTDIASRRDHRWHVVRTRPHKEDIAVANLQRQGYVTHLPRLRRTIRSARRQREVLRPLFPGYAFVRLMPAVDRWRPILGTIGVNSLIMDGDRPRPVPQGVVESLIAAADRGGVVDLSGHLRIGDRVRFQAGAFADRLASLVAIDERGRVQVLLEVLGAPRLVAAEARDLLRAGPSDERAD
jgi:transcription antitermination factor NusG